MKENEIKEFLKYLTENGEAPSVRWLVDKYHVPEKVAARYVKAVDTENGEYYVKYLPQEQMDKAISISNKPKVEDLADNETLGREEPWIRLVDMDVARDLLESYTFEDAVYWFSSTYETTKSEARRFLRKLNEEMPIYEPEPPGVIIEEPSFSGRDGNETKDEYVTPETPEERDASFRRMIAYNRRRGGVGSEDYDKYKSSSSLKLGFAIAWFTLPFTICTLKMIYKWQTTDVFGHEQELDGVAYIFWAIVLFFWWGSLCWCYFRKH